ncbi:hypothetical protein ACFU6R_15490 [Streptomyces sp. NPDC057499]|uniref:hypothetical protein n=1 Tax=Streptomyces sp. NPDC057499 TaxID=3346150 RepID=UPI0036C02086
MRTGSSVHDVYEAYEAFFESAPTCATCAGVQGAPDPGHLLVSPRGAVRGS